MYSSSLLPLSIVNVKQIAPNPPVCLQQQATNDLQAHPWWACTSQLCCSAFFFFKPSCIATVKKKKSPAIVMSQWSPNVDLLKVSENNKQIFIWVIFWTWTHCAVSSTFLCCFILFYDDQDTTQCLCCWGLTAIQFCCHFNIWSDWIQKSHKGHLSP